jgi:hypothetical protein
MIAFPSDEDESTSVVLSHLVKTLPHKVTFSHAKRAAAILEAPVSDRRT